MRKIRKEEIEKIVSDYYNISIANLKKKDRSKHLVRARNVLIVVLRDTLDMSYPAIGRALLRDHTTMMYAYNKGKTSPDLVDIKKLINKKKKELS